MLDIEEITEKVLTDHDQYSPSLNAGQYRSTAQCQCGVVLHHGNNARDLTYDEAVIKHQSFQVGVRIRELIEAWLTERVAITDPTAERSGAPDDMPSETDFIDSGKWELAEALRHDLGITGDAGASLNQSMPERMPGESIEEYTDRLIATRKPGTRRQCSIGWHEECSDRRPASAPEEDDCTCNCHLEGYDEHP